MFIEWATWRQAKLTCRMLLWPSSPTLLKFHIPDCQLLSRNVSLRSILCRLSLFLTFFIDKQTSPSSPKKGIRLELKPSTRQSSFPTNFGISVLITSRSMILRPLFRSKLRSSRCRTLNSRSLHRWHMASMRLPNNKGKARVPNWMRSNGCFWKRTHGSSLWPDWSACCTSCKCFCSLLFQHTKRKRIFWHRLIVYTSIASRCWHSSQMYLIGARRRKWLGYP